MPENPKSLRLRRIVRLWGAIKSWVLRPFPFRMSAAAPSAVFTLLLSALYLYMNVYNWRATVFLAFFFSITLILLLGTMIEQFRLKHWSVSYLTIVFIVSSFVSFFLLQVGILDSYPFGWVFVVGWTVSTLPFVVNISYNLFKVSRGQQLKNP